MQPISIAQPLRRSGRLYQPPVAISVDDVFGDRARLRDGVAIVGDDRRFSERMNRAQLGRRAHIRLTLIADDLVRKPKFFQQPQHALGAGIVEMMDGEHGDSPSGFWPAIWSCQPGIGKSRCPGAVYYPGIIDKPNLPG